jgi:putative flippase GtrA
MSLISIHRSTVRRLVRYGSVSAVSTATTLLLLGLLVLLGWPAVLSNVTATAVGTVPSFELNRRWVWGQGQNRSIARQVVPYCLLSLAGLVLSTVAVHVASDATGGASRLVHTAAVEAANVGTYGLLWLIQFALCDRVLFRDKTFTAQAQVAPRPDSDDGSSVCPVTAQAATPSQRKDTVGQPIPG